MQGAQAGAMIGGFMEQVKLPAGAEAGFVPGAGGALNPYEGANRVSPAYPGVNNIPDPVMPKPAMSKYSRAFEFLGGWGRRENSSYALPSTAAGPPEVGSMGWGKSLGLVLDANGYWYNKKTNVWQIPGFGIVKGPGAK
jgi:hypothetical protein